MKDIPLIFQPWGIRAILEGRKTVTRRLKFHGEPGDRVWVRERWSVQQSFDHLKPSELPSDTFVVYHASVPYSKSKLKCNGKTRNPLFLPKRFARIWLRVLNVREEHLQDITYQEFRREGLTGEPYRQVFAQEWNDINFHKPGSSYAHNPLVKPIEFEVITP